MRRKKVEALIDKLLRDARWNDGVIDKFEGNTLATKQFVRDEIENVRDEIEKVYAKPERREGNRRKKKSK